jgi:XisH protein
LAQRDIYHEAVKTALMKDGWTITHDPYPLRYGEHRLYVDLGAEAPIGAEREGRKIAVELKSFLGRSEITDLERALGQYRLYRFLIRRTERDRTLFIAVPEETYYAVFDPGDGRDLVVEEELQLIVFDPQPEVILEWIEPTNTVAS